MLPPEVVAYYECGDEQDRRPLRPAGWSGPGPGILLQRHLPDAQRPPSSTSAAARARTPSRSRWPGHDIHLIDAMPLHVAQAQQAAAAAGTELASTEVGDARELASRTERRRGAAARPALPPAGTGRAGRRTAEARRVLRPGGVLAAVAISRFASLSEGLAARLGRDHPGDRRGRPAHRDPPQPGAPPDRFTTAHFARPQELAAEVGAAGLTAGRAVRRRGPGRPARRTRGLAGRPGAARPGCCASWTRIETEASLLGASPHMAIAHRYGAAQQPAGHLDRRGTRGSDRGVVVSTA